MEIERLKSILESLLFTAEGPLPVDRFRSTIGSVERKEVSQALKELQEEYETQRRGVRLMEVANGFQLRTPREHAEYVRNLVPVKAARMGRANLETLAIVAYKQPITKAEIEEIRGVNVDGVVATLLDRRLVRMIARKDVPGKPFLYGTTKEFLETFNLKDLSGLPTLKEMEEMTRVLADDAGLALAGAESEATELESTPGEALVAGAATPPGSESDREAAESAGSEMIDADSERFEDPDRTGVASEDSGVESETEGTRQFEPTRSKPDSMPGDEKE